MALVLRCLPGSAEAVPRKRTFGLNLGLEDSLEVDSLADVFEMASATSSVVLRISSAVLTRQLAGEKLKGCSRAGRKV
ncbi:hypothetical protein TYRP_021763 [Tyrophagus putrescentiae]|nr:hypothetical protein TYRP_021763 [Tyrophagus putrescentiae]